MLNFVSCGQRPRTRKVSYLKYTSVQPWYLKSWKFSYLSRCFSESRNRTLNHRADFDLITADLRRVLVHFGERIYRRAGRWRRHRCGLVLTRCCVNHFKVVAVQKWVRLRHTAATWHDDFDVIETHRDFHSQIDLY